jgi:hypothetical protein
MQFFAAALRGAFAVGVSLIFIDDLSANPVPIEEDAGVETMKINATVEAVDVTRRLITVVGPTGPLVLVIGPAVQHVEKIKVREKVAISYQDEVAVAFRKADGPPAAAQDGFEAEETSGMGLNAPTVAEQDWVEATPSGATDLTTIEVTDTVAAINHNKRTITFAGTGGKTRTIWVGPNVAGFNTLEVGDMVVLEVTRATAVDITPL